MSTLKKYEWPSLMSPNFMSEFFDQDDSWMPKFMKHSLPAVNIKDLESKFEIELAVPGLSKKDINVSINHGILTISAEKKEEKEEKNKEYTRKEFSFSSFSRSFNLPENAEEEGIDANYEDGILKLSINKKKNAHLATKKPILVH